jgi:hypothetical protein
MTIKLPPLPAEEMLGTTDAHRIGIFGYTAKTVKRLRLEAIEAYKQQQQGEAVATLTMFDMRSQTGTVDLCGNWQELRVGDALYTRPAPAQQQGQVMPSAAELRDQIASLRSFLAGIEQAMPCLVSGDCKHGSWCTDVYCQEHCRFVKPVHQYRKEHCADWYDGFPDSEDGGGPYETRTLYTHPAQKANRDPLHDDIQSVLFEVEQAVENGCCPWQIEAAFEAYEAAQRLHQPAHGIGSEK